MAAEPAADAAPSAVAPSESGDEGGPKQGEATPAAFMALGALAVAVIGAALVVGFLLAVESGPSDIPASSSTKQGGDSNPETPEHCHFSYDGEEGPKPEKWGELTCLKEENMCGKGDAQSPIILPAIEDDKVTQGDLEMKGYETELKKFDVNAATGHAIGVEIKEETLPYLTGKNTVGDDKFYFKNFHFHLGNDDTKGSEHTIEGVTDPFSMEVHFIHLKAGKNSLAEALNDPSSAVVLSVLFKADDAAADSSADDALSAIIDKIGVTGDASKPLVMADFIGTLETYYFYTGSITTPPCTQGIKWVVFDTHPIVKSATLKRLRDMSPKVPKDNFRPPRPSKAVYNVQKFKREA